MKIGEFMDPELKEAESLHPTNIYLLRRKKSPQTDVLQAFNLKASLMT